MIKMENGYIPDKNSRYFIEDIKFGLCILKAFAEILEVKTPEIDKIVEWGQKFLDREYIVDGALGEVVIEVLDKKIRVKEETSSKHLCSKEGFTNDSLRPIICLPNKIVIKIINKKDNNDIDGVVY